MMEILIKNFHVRVYVCSLSPLSIDETAVEGGVASGSLSLLLCNK